MSQDLDGVEEFIRENREKLVAIGEVRECHMPFKLFFAKFFSCTIVVTHLCFISINLFA